MEAAEASETVEGQCIGGRQNACAQRCMLRYIVTDAGMRKFIHSWWHNRATRARHSRMWSWEHAAQCKLWRQALSAGSTAFLVTPPLPQARQRRPVRLGAKQRHACAVLLCPRVSTLLAATAVASLAPMRAGAA